MEGFGEIGLRMGNLVFNLMFMNITNSSDWCSTVLSLFLFGGRGWLRETAVSKETVNFNEISFKLKCSRVIIRNLNLPT